MVERDVFVRKIAAARSRLAAAGEIFARPIESFARDEKERDLATFYLFLAIQECIDIAAHWVADDALGVPDEAATTFEILRTNAILDEDIAKGLRGAVGLRNRIAHGYAGLDPGRMYHEFKAGAEVLKRFLSIAARRVDLGEDDSAEE